MKDLEQYLRENCSKGIIDHSIRATVDENGVKFYIHANGYNSDTLDYAVEGNKLIPITCGMHVEKRGE